MSIRAVVAWALYDFANSAFAAVVFATVYPANSALAAVGNRAAPATSGGGASSRARWRWPP